MKHSIIYNAKLRGCKYLFLFLLLCILGCIIRFIIHAMDRFYAPLGMTSACEMLLALLVHISFLMLIYIKNFRKHASLIMVLILTLYGITSLPDSVVGLILFSIGLICCIIFVFIGRQFKLPIILMCISHIPSIIMEIQFLQSFVGTDFPPVLYSGIISVIIRLIFAVTLAVFSLKNILPPIIALSTENALKHLETAKKLGAISENNYCTQRAKILSEL